MEIASECGWVWVLDSHVIITPKPRYCNPNNKYGPLVEYPDGWVVGRDISESFKKGMEVLRESNSERDIVSYLRGVKYPSNPEWYSEFKGWAKLYLEHKGFLAARDYL